MITIKSMEEFDRLRTEAIKIDGLRKTNFIMPAQDIEAAIKAGKVRYEKQKNSLCIIINKHGYDMLFYWLSEMKDVFIPDNVKNMVFTHYGRDGEKSEWEVAVKQLGYRKDVKSLRVYAKADSMNFEQVPLLPVNYGLEIKKNYNYASFMEIIKPFFDSITDDVPEEFEWINCQRNCEFAEIKDELGNIAAFQTRHFQGKRCTLKKTLVLPDYRGQGLGKYLLMDAANRCEYLSGWIHDDNLASLNLHKMYGLKPDGQYRVFYLN